MKPIYSFYTHDSIFNFNPSYRKKRNNGTLSVQSENSRTKQRLVKLIMAIVGLCLILTSCEKRLELVPETTFSDATFFTTGDQFKLFVNQFYSNLPNINSLTASEAKGDFFMDRNTNPISDGSYSATPTNDLWNSSYARIRNTTYLIEKGNEATGSLRSEVAVYVGEARFFRALAYFSLLSSFGDVPIIDKVLSLTDADELYGSRNSREEVVNFILNDLESAIDELPQESSISANDRGRVSKGAALSLKAIVALFEGTWRKFRNMDGWQELLDEAIYASGEVMRSGEYEIFDRRDVLGEESYRYFFILDKVQSNPAGLTKVDQKENIFVSRFDETLRPMPIQQQAINGSGNPTQKFADMFSCIDGLPIDKSPLYMGKATIFSEYENRDLRMKNIFVMPFSQMWESAPVSYARDWADPYAGGYPDVQVGGNILKFGSNTMNGYAVKKLVSEIPKPSVDMPIIRFAEVLLINAEALYEKNEMITDAQLDATINKLRARAGVASLSNTLVSGHGLDMRTEIRRERNIELFREGHRYDDLRRWKTAEVELPMALRGVLWRGTQYETDPAYTGVSLSLDAEGYVVTQPSSQRKFDPAKNYLSPLPLIEISLNPQLEQNPGW